MAQCQGVLVTPYRVSPSALKVARRCLRRWGWRYIAGIREPDTLPTLVGGLCHAIVEGYLNGAGLLGPERWCKVVAQGVDHLPVPGTVRTEVPWEFDLDGVSFRGYIDWVDDSTHAIGDHKFVSSLRWQADLATDEQSICYSLAMGWPSTSQTWLYYRKDCRGVDPITHRTTRALAEQIARERFLPLALTMTSLHAAAQHCQPDEVWHFVQAIPCDLHDCWSFRRPCPYSSICNQ